MFQSTVTSKGQTTLPRAVRDALGLGPGDRVRYVVTPEGVRLIKVQPVMRLAGSLRHAGPPVSLEDMDEAIAAAATERSRLG
ncbi:MAG: AbrB/MazE/SpoVT family DNA-binding domain-containing protein [Geminicoccaceae bacterium]|nr:MAG: AbrB/MazE/SpoVT family DNA-binding domain-containing protein [Geminicoccaceae bacterium]